MWSVILGVDPSVLSNRFKKVMGIQYRLNEFDFMDVSKTRMLESDKVMGYDLASYQDL